MGLYLLLQYKRRKRYVMKIIKLTAIILTVLMITTGLTGCTDLVSKFYPVSTGEESTYGFIPETAADGEILFKDFDGNVISMPSAPEKIVSVSSIATEIICGLGASRYIIGLDDGSSRLEGAPIGATVLPYYYMSYNEIVALEPDVVFYTTEYISVLTLEALKESGVKLIRIPSTGNIETAESNIRFIASLLYREEAGNKMIDEMRHEFDKIKTAAQLVGVRKRIYIEYISDFCACGGNTLISEICDMAGFDNVFEDLEGFTSVTAAAVTEKNPEVILVAGFASASENSVRTRKSIEKVSAVRENKIYLFNINNSIRPTQSIVNAAKEIAKILGTTN